MNISKKNRNSGMTLIEILIVIALLGVLASVLVKTLGKSLNAGKEAAARLFCETTFKSAYESFKVSTGKSTIKIIDELEGFLGTKAPKDPWGSLYTLLEASELAGDDAQIPKDGGGTPLLSGAQKNKPQRAKTYHCVFSIKPSGEYIYAYLAK